MQLLITNRKTEGLLSVFSKLAVLATLLILVEGCTTVERSRRTSDGRMVPGRKIFDVMHVQNLCEPIVNRNIKEIQELLNEYGRNGWEVSSFLYRDGNVSGVCLHRK